MTRLCDRPGCAAPARVSYGFDVDGCLVWLDAVTEERNRAGALCGPHADRMRVPLGWFLDDRRQDPPTLFAGPTDEAEPATSIEVATEPPEEKSSAPAPAPRRPRRKRAAPAAATAPKELAETSEIPRAGPATADDRSTAVGAGAGEAPLAEANAPVGPEATAPAESGGPEATAPAESGGPDAAAGPALSVVTDADPVGSGSHGGAPTSAAPANGTSPAQAPPSLSLVAEPAPGVDADPAWSPDFRATELAADAATPMLARAFGSETTPLPPRPRRRRPPSAAPGPASPG